MLQFGDTQVASGNLYGREGYVIEMYYGTHWAIPAWEEMGCPGLAETYPTKEAAEAALNEYKEMGFI